MLPIPGFIISFVILPLFSYKRETVWQYMVLKDIVNDNKVQKVKTIQSFHIQKNFFSLFSKCVLFVEKGGVREISSPTFTLDIKEPGIMVK